MGHKWRKILTGRRVRAIAIAGGFAPAFAVLAHSPSTSVERGDLERYRLEEECVPAKEQYRDPLCRNSLKEKRCFSLR
jgi:hypothetical protein